MKLDSTHRPWLLASVGIIVISLVVYVPYAISSPQGPRGGSFLGLVFGILGFACMLFAAALGARKRVPTWRLGRAQAWMRGHLWLGFLALPLILFHGGFHFGGTLTQVLMLLLIITVVSGIFGAALQNYLPRILTADVPLETIYDEIKHVRAILREEADRSVESLCGSLGFGKSKTEEENELEASQRAGGFTALRALSSTTVALRTSAAVSAGASAAAVAAAPEILLLDAEQASPLKRFYLNEMRPYLEQPLRRGARLADAGKARSAFTALRTLLPPASHTTLGDLEDICEEARQLARQERLHHWLHTWLLAHIPLSLALILLGAVHAIMALRY